jgi:hypothetical protein
VAERDRLQPAEPVAETGVAKPDWQLVIDQPAPVAGENGHVIINAYALAFFDQYLKKNQERRLTVRHGDFPKCISKPEIIERLPSSRSGPSRMLTAGGAVSESIDS